MTTEKTKTTKKENKPKTTLLRLQEQVQGLYREIELTDGVADSHEEELDRHCQRLFRIEDYLGLASPETEDLAPERDSKPTTPYAGPSPVEDKPVDEPVFDVEPEIPWNWFSFNFGLVAGIILGMVFLAVFK